MIDKDIKHLKELVLSNYETDNVKITKEDDYYYRLEVILPKKTKGFNCIYPLRFLSFNIQEMKLIIYVEIEKLR